MPVNAAILVNTLKKQQFPGNGGRLLYQPERRGCRGRRSYWSALTSDLTPPVESCHSPCSSWDEWMEGWMRGWMRGWMDEEISTRTQMERECVKASQSACYMPPCWVFRQYVTGVLVSTSLIGLSGGGVSSLTFKATAKTVSVSLLYTQ